MKKTNRFRLVRRPWLAALLTLVIVLGTGALASAAPPKQKALSISLLSPANGATVSDTIMVTAKVTGTPTSVQYRIDGGYTAGLVQSSGGQWSAPWNTMGTVYGSRTVEVIATDATGKVVTDSARVTIDNRVVTIKVLNPTEKATVTGKVTLQATVASSGNLTSVTYAAGLGGPEVPMAFNPVLGYWEALWDTSTLPLGPIALYFRATDDIGKSGSLTRNVTIGSTMPATGEWLHSRGDLQNRAYTPEAYGTSFAPLWTNQWEAGHARLSLYNGILYAANRLSSGSLYGLDAATGKLIFDLKLESVISPAAVGPEAAYISVMNRSVVAVRPDGSILWRSAVTGSSAPLLTEHGLLVGDATGVVYALDPKTGEALWSVPTGERYGFNHNYMPVYAEGRLYLPGSDTVPVIDLVNRQLAFTIHTSPWEGLMYDGGLLYVANMSSLIAYDGATGAMKWYFNAPAYIGTPPAAANGIVIVGADEPMLYALDGATGQVLWSQVIDTYGSAYGSPVIAGDLVYTGAYFGGLKVFNLYTGEYQGHILPDQEVRDTPIPAGGILYIPDAQWGVYALKRQ